MSDFQSNYMNLNGTHLPKTLIHKGHGSKHTEFEVEILDPVKENLHSPRTKDIYMSDMKMN